MRIESVFMDNDHLSEAFAHLMQAQATWLIVIISIHRPPKQFKMPLSHSLEEIHIGKLFHLIHISLRLDDFLIIKQDPRLLSPLRRNSFADEGDVMPALSSSVLLTSMCRIVDQTYPA